MYASYTNIDLCLCHTDILIYNENDSHIWAVDDAKVEIPRENFYPLIWRPLGEVLLPAPRDTLFALHSRYKYLSKPHGFKCKHGHWDHAKEDGRSPRKSANCSELFDTYPHVVEETLGDGLVRELLVRNGTVVNSFTLPQTRNSTLKSNRPYGL